MVKDLPVSKIMTKKENVVSLRIPGNRDSLLDLIKETGLSVYPVLKKDSDEVVGIVSRSDLFKNPDETQLSLLMVRKPITIKPNESVIKAAKIFTENMFQRMPVVDEEEGKYLIGIVSRHDIVKKVVVPAKIQAGVEQYLKKYVTTIWERTPLPAAATVLRLSHQKAIPVIDSSKMIGIITQHDFLKVAEILDSQSKSRTGHGAENDSSSWDSESVLIIGSRTLTLPENMKVNEIMERNVEVCYSDSTIAEVSIKMVKKNYDQLPVVEADGSIIGIINYKNIIRAYIDFYEGKI
ncbi:MAG: CBS domain-containing protein [Candidatus Hodarchaeales archaeon]